MLAIIAIIIFANIISSFVFTRIDLTTEKRYSLSPTTIDLIKSLDDVVYFKVYLEGDFPAPFKRLRNATKEMLDEMRAYSNGNIEYAFINPSASSDPQERQDIYKQLYERGLQPTDLEERGSEGTSTRIIWPGAIVTYMSNDQSLLLLKQQAGAGTEAMLNNSIQNLEYEIANTLRKLSQQVKPHIAFVEDHGALNQHRVADITRELSGYYHVQRIRMDEQLKSLNGFQAVVIAKPDSAFTEKNKFILDQFIMRGGKMLWVLDYMSVSMDSLQNAVETMAMGKNLNLDDILFRYGARINYDLIQDMKAAPIPVVTGYVANKPQQTLLPWYYFPLLSPASAHPIVKNMNMVKAEFASSLDTIGIKDVQKTILLSSSKFSRLLYAPVRVSLNAMREEPNPEQFNRPYQAVAVLLEGYFSSVFQNRIPPQIADAQEINFKEKSVLNKMIVISDGNIIENQIRSSTGNFFPLGYDRYTNTVYGNKNFILNCVDYLLDDTGLISLRTKEFKLRLLDKPKVDEEKTTWQAINLVAPVILVLIFGIIKSFIRRKRYAA
ncbi:MAG: gliding motility-associated ABC transporter substrate-binding protein GldG [Bacteroidia bacterium]